MANMANTKMKIQTEKKEEK